MKKVITIALIMVLTLTVAVGSGAVLADKPQNPDGLYNGNGAPSGPHYNLNLIGVPKDKNSDGEGSNGHRIFVDLDGKTRILLQEGDYQVIDFNGTDGIAKFQLPAPDADEDGITAYSVFVRVVGKPGGSGTITSGFIDELGNQWLSVESVILIRESGQSKFRNVSKELLYVYVDMDSDGNVERYPLFCDELWQFFWDYDNNGLKVVQLRFYEIPTDVN